MTILKPIFVQPSGGDATIYYPGSELRQLVQALAGSGNDGVINPVSRVVSHRAAGADMSVDVAAFQGIVAGGDTSEQGSYLITNTAVYNFSPIPTTPSGSTRVHRLIAQVRDKRANGSYSTYDWVVQLLQDTSGGATPAEPASALTLALISVSTGQSNVQDSHISLSYPVLRNLAPAGPWYTAQSAAAPWNDNSGTWHDFLSGSWAPVTFTVPPSGIVRVTIQAGITVNNPSGGFAGIGYRISGGDTVNANLARSVGFNANGTCHACSTRIIPSLTPGASDTVTPAWYTNSTGNTDTADGQLIVEAVR